MRTVSNDEVHPPSAEAIVLHTKRAEYVLKMMYSAPQRGCSEIMKYKAYGWAGTHGSIEIQWDSKENLSRLTGSTGGCSCKTACTTRRCGCVNRKVVCTSICKCVNCSNLPAIQEELDGDSSSTESDSEETEGVEVEVITDEFIIV